MRAAAFQCHGWICISQIFGPHHEALEPLGAWHWCQHVPPCSQRAALRPSCVQRAETPRCGGMLFPTPTAPTALPQLTQKLFKQVFLKKMEKKVVCSLYSANSDKGFCVISSTLFPLFLVHDLYRVLNLYSQGHPH